jgi:hypothetical protein
MQIPLGEKEGRPQFALCSPEDYDFLMKYMWRCNQYGYVKGNINGFQKNMHRVVMNASKTQIVDHKNHERHDNRRENLRFVTAAENAQNRKKCDRASSRYRGVSFCKLTKKYRSFFQANKQRIFIGEFTKEEDAAEEFDVYVFHNKHSHELNFPEKVEEYKLRTPKVKPRKRLLDMEGVIEHENNYEAKLGNIYIGHFDDKISAARAVDEYIVKQDIGRDLNFPEDYPNFTPKKKVKTLCEDVDEHTVRLIIGNSPNSAALLDRSDYDTIKHIKWHVNSAGYLQDSEIRLHRYILDQTDPLVLIDHKNSNRIDNRRSNLRLSNHQLNAQTKRKREGTTSKYIGVIYDRCRSNPWSFSINHKGIIHRGAFKTEEIAARKRDLYLMDNFADQHFPLSFT